MKLWFNPTLLPPVTTSAATVATTRGKQRHKSARSLSAGISPPSAK